MIYYALFAPTMKGRNMPTATQSKKPNKKLSFDVPFVEDCLNASITEELNEDRLVITVQEGVAYKYAGNSRHMLNLLRHAWAWKICNLIVDQPILRPHHFEPSDVFDLLKMMHSEDRQINLKAVLTKVMQEFGPGYPSIDLRNNSNDTRTDIWLFVRYNNGMGSVSCKVVTESDMLLRCYLAGL